MKFGKLPTVDNVDFTLLPDPQGNERILQNTKTATPQNHLYIGATGWRMKEWVGKYYPIGAKAPNFLEHYTQQFNTIELNTTHYRVPDELTVEKWYNQSAADFKFCPKVPQLISHNSGLSPDGPINMTRQFCEAVAGLKEKLGPCFIQLPPYFSADRLPILEAFLENWNRSEIPLAVEVRHDSWFNNSLNINKLAALLEKFGTSTVITDVAGRRDVCHMRLTNETAVIRFVGNDLHPTDYSRIDEWVERLKLWFENGLKNAYFFTHEPDNILAPELAAYLHQKLNGFNNLNLRGPVPLEHDIGGQQMSLF